MNAKRPSVTGLGLLLLGTVYTLYFARPILLLIVLAVLLDFLLSPLVSRLGRLHVPEAVGAAVVLLALVAAVGVGAYRLYDPATQWLDEAPRAIQKVERRLRHLKEPAEKVGQAAAEVQQLASVGSTGDDRAVTVDEPPLSRRLISGTWQFLASAVVLVALLYFMLASGDLFLRKLVKVIPRLRDKRQAVQIARQTRRDISTYLYTVTIINLSQGILVGAALWLLGMPNPVLWGVVSAVLNYVPYLGPLVMTAVLSGAALLTFESMDHALLMPAAYVALHLSEAYLVTPMILGRRLTLNTVVVFVGLIFWGWIWGVPGALIAVPLMATLKILCDHIEPLQPIGEFMGR